MPPAANSQPRGTRAGPGLASIEFGGDGSGSRPMVGYRTKEHSGKTGSPKRVVAVPVSISVFEKQMPNMPHGALDNVRTITAKELEHQKFELSSPEKVKNYYVQSGIDQNAWRNIGKPGYDSDGKRINAHGDGLLDDKSTGKSDGQSRRSVDLAVKSSKSKSKGNLEGLGKEKLKEVKEEMKGSKEQPRGSKSIPNLAEDSSALGTGAGGKDDKRCGAGEKDGTGAGGTVLSLMSEKKRDTGYLQLKQRDDLCGKWMHDTVWKNEFYKFPRETLFGSPKRSGGAGGNADDDGEVGDVILHADGVTHVEALANILGGDGKDDPGEEPPKDEKLRLSAASIDKTPNKKKAVQDRKEKKNALKRQNTAAQIPDKLRFGRLNTVAAAQLRALGRETPPWVKSEQTLMDLGDEGDVSKRDLDVDWLDDKLDKDTLKEYHLTKHGVKKGVPSAEDFESHYRPTMERRLTEAAAEDAAMRKKAAMRRGIKSEEDEEEDEIANVAAALGGYHKTVWDLMELIDDPNAHKVVSKLDRQVRYEMSVPANVHTRTAKEAEEAIKAPVVFDNTRESILDEKNVGWIISETLGKGMDREIVVPRSASKIRKAEEAEKAEMDPYKLKALDGSRQPILTTLDPNQVAARKALEAPPLPEIMGNSPSRKGANALFQKEENPLIISAADASQPHIYEYKLWCSRLDVEPWDRIYDLYEKVMMQKCFSINNVEFSTLHCKCIAKGLNKLPHIKYLDIVECDMNSSGLYFILQSCIETLEVLYLDKVTISLNCIELIYKALYPRRRNAILSHLVLKNCGLGVEDNLPGYEEWVDEEGEEGGGDEDSDDDGDSPINRRGLTQIRTDMSSVSNNDPKTPVTKAMMGLGAIPTKASGIMEDIPDSRIESAKVQNIWDALLFATRITLQEEGGGNQNEGLNEVLRQIRETPNDEFQRDSIISRIKSFGGATGELYADNDPNRRTAFGTLEDGASELGDDVASNDPIEGLEGKEEEQEPGQTRKSSDRSTMVAATLSKILDGTVSDSENTMDFTEAELTAFLEIASKPLRLGTSGVDSTILDRTVRIHRASAPSAMRKYVENRERALFSGLGNDAYSEHQIANFMYSVVQTEGSDIAEQVLARFATPSANTEDAGSSYPPSTPLDFNRPRTKAGLGSVSGSRSEKRVSINTEGQTSEDVFLAMIKQEQEKEGRLPGIVEEDFPPSPLTAFKKEEEKRRREQNAARITKMGRPSQGMNPKARATEETKAAQRKVQRESFTAHLAEREDGEESEDDLEPEDPRVTMALIKARASDGGTFVEDEGNEMFGFDEAEIDAYTQAFVGTSMAIDAQISDDRNRASFGGSAAGLMNSTNSNLSGGTMKSNLLGVPGGLEGPGGDRYTQGGIGVEGGRHSSMMGPIETDALGRPIGIDSVDILTTEDRGSLRSNITGSGGAVMNEWARKNEYSIVEHFQKPVGLPLIQPTLLICSKNLRKYRRYFRGLIQRPVPDGNDMHNHALDVLKVSMNWNGYPPDSFDQRESSEGYPIVMPLLAISMVLPCLHTLDLTSNMLTARGWSTFETLLKSTKSIQVLILDNTGVSDISIHPLCAGLSKNVSLRSLSMKNVNVVQDFSIVLLLHTVEHHVNLLYFNYLHNCWGKQMLNAKPNKMSDTNLVVPTATSATRRMSVASAARLKHFLSDAAADSDDEIVPKTPKKCDGPAVVAQKKVDEVQSLSPSPLAKARPKGPADTPKMSAPGANAPAYSETVNEPVYNAFVSMLENASMLSCVHVSLPECELQSRLRERFGWKDWWAGHNAEHVVLWRGIFARDFYNFPRTKDVINSEKVQTATFLAKKERLKTLEHGMMRGPPRTVAAVEAAKGMTSFGERNSFYNVDGRLNTPVEFTGVGLSSRAKAAAVAASGSASLASGVGSAKAGVTGRRGPPPGGVSSLGEGSPVKAGGSPKSGASGRPGSRPQSAGGGSEKTGSTGAAKPMSGSPTGAAFGVFGVFETSSHEFFAWYCDPLNLPNVDEMTIPSLECTDYEKELKARTDKMKNESDGDASPGADGFTSFQVVAKFSTPNSKEKDSSNKMPQISTFREDKDAEAYFLQSYFGIGKKPAKTLKANLMASRLIGGNFGQPESDRGTDDGSASNASGSPNVKISSAGEVSPPGRNFKSLAPGDYKAHEMRALLAMKRDGRSVTNEQKKCKTVVAAQETVNDRIAKKHAKWKAKRRMLENISDRVKPGAEGSVPTLKNKAGRPGYSPTKSEGQEGRLSAVNSKISLKPANNDRSQTAMENRDSSANSVTSKYQISIAPSASNSVQQSKDNTASKKQVTLRVQTPPSPADTPVTAKLKPRKSQAPALEVSLTKDQQKAVVGEFHNSWAASQRCTIPHPIAQFPKTQFYHHTNSWVGDRYIFMEFVWNFPKSGLEGHSLHIVPSFLDFAVIPMNIVLQTNRNTVFRVGLQVPSYCEYIYYFFYDPIHRKLLCAEDQPRIRMKNLRFYKDILLKSVSMGHEEEMTRPITELTPLEDPDNPVRLIHPGKPLSVDHGHGGGYHPAGLGGGMGRISAMPGATLGTSRKTAHVAHGHGHDPNRKHDPLGQSEFNLGASVTGGGSGSNAQQIPTGSSKIFLANLDVAKDFPSYINYRKIPAFAYPHSTIFATKKLHEQLPDIGKDLDQKLYRYTKEWISYEEFQRLHVCYKNDIARLDIRGLVRQVNEERYKSVIREHYLELYQSYCLLCGGVQAVRHVDIMVFFDLIFKEALEPNEMLKYIQEAVPSPTRVQRHEFLYLTFMFSLVLFSTECHSDAAVCLDRFVKEKLRVLISYPLNPFTKKTMQHPLINQMCYDNMVILKDAYLRYGTSRDSFIQLIYILRICDKNFNEFHIGGMFAMAKRFNCKPTDYSRLTYPEFCEAIVRIAAGGLPQKGKYAGKNLSLFPKKLAKVADQFCKRIAHKIKENIRAMSKHSIKF